MKNLNLNLQGQRARKALNFNFWGQLRNSGALKCKSLGAVFAFAFMLAACSSQNEFDAMGIFESDEIIVSSEISGKIIDLNLSEGEKLEQNALVGLIDTTQLELSLKALSEQIKALKAKKSDIEVQIAPLKEQLDTATRELERAKRLYQSEASTKKSLDDANSAFLLISKEINSKLSTMNLNNEALDADIARTQIQMAITQDNIQKAHIRSPILGQVLEKYAYAGELSSPAKPLFKIADTETLRLKAYIIDTDLTRAKLGDKIKVYSDFGEGYKEYEGVLSFISAQAEFTPKTIMSKDERKNLVYAVKIDVKNDGFLKIGSYGEIKLAR